MRGMRPAPEPARAQVRMPDADPERRRPLGSLLRDEIAAGRDWGRAWDATGPGVPQRRPRRLAKIVRTYEELADALGLPAGFEVVRVTDDASRPGRVEIVYEVVVEIPLVDLDAGQEIPVVDFLRTARA